MNIPNRIISAFLSCAVVYGAVSCVDIDMKLGQDVIPTSEKYITRVVNVPIEDVYMGTLDSLSGYNTMRIVVGAINDEDFGLRRHGTALCLAPVRDTLNWGTNVRLKKFHFTTATDSCFTNKSSDLSLIQNVKVYALDEDLDSTYIYSCDKRLSKSHFEGKPTISRGTATLNGTDSLSLNFSLSFASTYVPQRAFVKSPFNVVEVYDSVQAYSKKHPGIYICTDDPVGYGGRVNFLTLDITAEDNGLVTSAYAELSFMADYIKDDGTIRENVDTSFLFRFGPSSFNSSNCTASCFQTVEHIYSGAIQPDQYATDKIYVEGGLGIKPMIEAKHLRDILMEALKDTLTHYGMNPETAFRDKEAIINRATVYLPYDAPSDYTKMDYYPHVLNPTVRISSENSVNFAGLTDATVSSENQGDIFRDKSCYKPDVSFYMQQVMSTPADSVKLLTKSNMWFLVLADETYTTPSSSSSESDYYNQLAYLNYYNQMMGGYGGYGSYGSYGYGSSNYYNYYMMQAYYNSLNSSSSTTTTVTLPDTDRYYHAVLNGPNASGQKPQLIVTYTLTDNRE